MDAPNHAFARVMTVVMWRTSVVPDVGTGSSERMTSKAACDGLAIRPRLG